MKAFQFSKWHPLGSNSNPAPAKQGVYVVRTLANGRARQIRCPGGVDRHGILYIGSTASGGTLKSRIGDLLGGRNNPKLFGHHCFSRRYYSYQAKLIPLFGAYDALEVAWRVTSRPPQEERKLCGEYYGELVCLPPLNWRFAGSGIVP